MESKDDKPEELLVRQELSEAIQVCLDRLEFEFRTIVVLVDIQGLDYASVAKIVDRPLGTIKSRLARARQNLRDCLLGFRELLPVEFRHVGEV